MCDLCQQVNVLRTWNLVPTTLEMRTSLACTGGEHASVVDNNTNKQWRPNRKARGFNLVVQRMTCGCPQIRLFRHMYSTKPKTI
jgi:hypothetical protein